MINVYEHTFVLSTNETTLLLRVNEVGKLVCDTEEVMSTPFKLEQRPRNIQG